MTHHMGRNFKSEHFRNSEMLYSKSIWFYHIWGCYIDYASFQSNKILKTLKRTTTLYIHFYYVSEDLYMSFSTDLLIDQKWHLLSFIQSNLYYKVIFGTMEKWPYKTGDLLKEVLLIWKFLWQDKKKMSF